MIPRRVVVWVAIFFSADILSLMAYTIPALNSLLLILCVVGTLYLLVSDKRWLVFLPLAELLWGSFGSSFAWDIGGFRLSIRMLVFVIAVIVWLGSLGYGRSIAVMRQSKSMSIFFIVLIAITAWGFFIGLISARPLSDVFLDGNAYLYLGYLPLWLYAYREEDLANVRALVIGAAVAMALKTLVLFNLFANGYEMWNLQYLYLWIRDTRMGEITSAGGPVWRIFLQSQLFVGVVLVQSIVLLIWRGVSKHRFVVVTLCFAALLASLSRSYWLGAAAAVALIFIFFAKQLASMWRTTIPRIGAIMLAGIVAFLLLVGLVAIPYGATGITSSLSSRISSVSEAAVNSRLQLLGPLLSAIYVHPLRGSGFGASVAYHSDDPRIKNALNPTGDVSTYAFEWGYFDQWLKFGLVGVLAFVGGLIWLLYRGWRTVRADPGAYEITAMLLAGLVFIMIVHVTSPYLNHPLGIGYLMFTMLVLGGKETADEKSHHQPRYL